MSGNGYYSEDVLKQMGFSSLGKNVKISEKASLYGISRISIGSNVRLMIMSRYQQVSAASKLALTYILEYTAA